MSNMDVKIENKDIKISHTGTPLYIDEVEEIAQRVKIACSVRKGSFIYDRELGSYAHTLDVDDEMFIEKLEMIYKEATIDIPYTKLRVVSVDKTAVPVVAYVEVVCGTKSVVTEVTING